MITSAKEFIRLRTSEVMAEYHRAAHEEAPLEIWWELVREHPEMKTWVVHNKTVPIEILEALTTDPDPAVRYAVATKRKAPPAILAQLAVDADSGVRSAVANNAKTPPEVLRLLLNDEWDDLAARAKARLAELEANSGG